MVSKKAVAWALGLGTAIGLGWGGKALYNTGEKAGYAQRQAKGHELEEAAEHDGIAIGLKRAKEVITPYNEAHMRFSHVNLTNYATNMLNGLAAANAQFIHLHRNEMQMGVLRDDPKSRSGGVIYPYDLFEEGGWSCMEALLLEFTNLQLLQKYSTPREFSKSFQLQLEQRTFQTQSTTLLTSRQVAVVMIQIKNQTRVK